MADDGGIYTGTALADKTFYGFRLDYSTGQLYLDIINDGSTVRLPDTYTTSTNDYRANFWSSDTIRFQWGAQGRLQMVFL